MARRVGFADDAPPTEEGWEAYLDPGEELLWTGQPGIAFKMKPMDYFVSAFGFVFLSFALVWTGLAGFIFTYAKGADNPGVIFPLFGVPFILVGLYLLFGRFFWRKYARRRTRYAVTNRRAIIATSALGRRMASYPFGEMAKIERVFGPPDTIYFATKYVRTKNGGHDAPIGFEDIPDGGDVARLLRRVKAGEAP